jgi:hypothetical protein
MSTRLRRGRALGLFKLTNERKTRRPCFCWLSSSRTSFSIVLNAILLFLIPHRQNHCCRSCQLSVMVVSRPNRLTITTQQHMYQVYADKHHVRISRQWTLTQFER